MKIQYEFIAVDRSEDENFGIKTLDTKQLMQEFLNMNLPHWYGGDIYLCEFTQEFLVEESKRQAEYNEVEDLGFEDMLDYWCEHLGFSWKYLENGNVLYATSEL